MPRLCCRKGKRPNRFQTPPIQSEFVSASDWVNRASTANTTTTSNSGINYNHNMDLHVHSSQLQQQQQQQQQQYNPSSPPLSSIPSGIATSTTATTSSTSFTTTNIAQKRMRHIPPPSFLSPENVASVPPPGLSAPSQPMFLTIPGSSRHGNVLEGDDDDERIILSYVAVQPKASYPSSAHGSNNNNSKSRVSAGGGLRSLYRPLTTSATTTTSAGHNHSSNNSSSTNVNYTHVTHPNSSSSSTPTTSSNPVSAPTHSNTPTERVLMCYDLTPSTYTTTGSRDHDSDASMQPTQVSIAHTPSSSLSLPSSQLQQPQPSVPLLRWQSNFLTLLGRASNNKNHKMNNAVAASTTSKRRGMMAENSNGNTTGNSNSSVSSSSNSTISNHTMNESISSTNPLLPTTNKASSVPTAATNSSTTNTTPLEERLLRERLKVGPGSAGSLTQFHWANVRDNGTPHHNDRNDVNETSEKYSDAKSSSFSRSHIRLLIPARGSLYIQDGIDTNMGDSSREHDSSKVRCICIHDKSVTGMSATDAQLSPDGSMVAWTHDGEIYVQSAQPRTFDPTLIPSVDTAALLLDDSFLAAATSTTTPAVRISFGASQTESCCITHGVADFVAQEEMDRYRGFWWHPNSNAILFTRNDESEVPIYRIMHQSNSSALPSFSSSQQHTDHSSSQHYESNGSSNGLFATSKITTNAAFEDHRYPFAGKMNPSVKLGLVKVDRDSVLDLANTTKPTPKSKSISDCLERRDGIDSDETTGYDNDDDDYNNTTNDPMACHTCQDIAAENWSNCVYFDAPSGVDEYLARVHIIPDGRAIAQWQNRSQTCTILYLIDLNDPIIFDTTTGNAKGQVLLVERSDIWINLHHMFYLLPRPIHPDECQHNHAMDINKKCAILMPNPLPKGSFSFLFASEKTGYAHLYLYTFCPGTNKNEAALIRSLTSGKWTVENILGVDLDKDVVYFAGTYDSVLERHLYSIPLLNVSNEHKWRFGSYPTAAPPTSNETGPVNGTVTQSSLHPKLVTSDDHAYQNISNGGMRSGLSKVMHVLSGKGNSSAAGNSATRLDQSEIFFTTRAISEMQCPTRLTLESGMHSIVMDEKCRYFVATSSDVDRPTTVKVYELPTNSRKTIRQRATIYNAANDDAFTSTNVTIEYKTNGISDMVKCLPAPELISFPTSDGTETLHAALYRPNPHLYGPGPYPLVCAVYGGPHVQRVNRSWSQSADMRAQRLRSLGFCVVKCDNRGSSRRGLSFESAISRRLGRLEVLDQVAAVRQLVVRGIADPTRVGVYGWSYGGYLSAMCLCRAPDVFHVAVAGAPVTSWDGYDTHYTERYMGLPADNPSGYRESAVFDHVPNMRGKLMIVHGLIDENVHFRHTTRLINKLIAAGKDYDLLIFPEERHSPRRLRDRIYMEQRISEYFARHLSCKVDTEPLTVEASVASLDNTSVQELRPMAGHL